VLINKVPATFFKSGEGFEFTADIDISVTDFVTVVASDVYDNTKTVFM